MQIADLFDDIHESIINDRLSLPSLPDLALRIHRIAGDPDCTFDTIGKALRNDAALSAQLIRLANSAFYSTRVPATNLRSAVHRIGVPGVRNFVMKAALRNLFPATDPHLGKRFQKCWQDSLEISALTTVLATSGAGFDPDDALLAGLLQDIGVVALLGQLSQVETALPDEAALQDGIDYWAPRIGELALKNWGFDQRYIEVVAARHNWSYETDCTVNLVDFVNVARLHFYIADGRGAPLPALDSLPSFNKLPDRRLSESGSLQLLDNAAAEVARIRAMLGTRETASSGATTGST